MSINKLGMLWLNRFKKPMRNAIEDGIRYYQRKYGEKPNLIYINPSQKEKEEIPDTIKGIEIREDSQMLYNHCWIGVA